MALNEALKKLKFDTRLTEWYLKNNLMTQEEINNHLNALPDVASNINISTDDEESEDEIIDIPADETH